MLKFLTLTSSYNKKQDLVNYYRSILVLWRKCSKISG